MRKSNLEASFITYGPKTISEAQAKIVQQLTNRTIWRLALILLRAKRKAERGGLEVVRAWKIDKRTRDDRLQAALAKRAEQYQKPLVYKFGCFLGGKNGVSPTKRGRGIPDHERDFEPARFAHLAKREARARGGGCVR